MAYDRLTASVGVELQQRRCETSLVLTGTRSVAQQRALGSRAACSHARGLTDGRARSPLSAPDQLVEKRVNTEMREQHRQQTSLRLCLRSSDESGLHTVRRHWVNVLVRYVHIPCPDAQTVTHRVQSTCDPDISEVVICD